MPPEHTRSDRPPDGPTGATRPAGPIYVGGLDRSGKTTLSAFLSSHQNIAIPPVGSNMWTYFYGQFGDLRVRRNFERCLSALLRYKHVRILEPDPARIATEFQQGPATYARLFALVLEHYAERVGKLRWGAQTGLIERYADKMFDAYEDLHIVHMVRDPRDRYLASLERWPDGRGRAGGAAARWRYSTGLGERHAERHPDRYLVVRFEDLVDATAPTLEAVCRFVGEEFQPTMLAMDGAPTHRARLLDGTVDSGSDQLLTSAHVGRFRGRLPAGELAYLQRHLGRQMARFGYEPDVVERSRSQAAHDALLGWPNQSARMAAWRTVEALQQRLPRMVRRKPGKRMIVEPASVAVS